MRFFWESLLLLHRVHFALSMDSLKASPKAFLTFWNFLAMWNQSKIGSIVWQWGSRTEMTDQQLLPPSAKGHTSLLTQPLFKCSMMQVRLDGFQVVIECWNHTTFISNLVMVLIDKLQTARSIDYTRQSFKTRLPRSLVGIWPHQLAQSTPRQGRITPLGSEVSDSDQIAALPLGWWCVEFGRGYWHCGVDSWVSRGCPEPPGNYAMPLAHIAVSLNRMGIGAKLVVGVLCQLQWILATMLCKRNLWSLKTAWNFDGTKPYLESFAPHFGLSESRLRLLAQLKHFAP